MRTWILIACIVTAVLIAVAALLLWRRKKQQAASAAPAPKKRERTQSSLQLQQNLSDLFVQELRLLDQNVGGPEGRYSMPWCLVLGSPGAGQSTLLAHTGMHVPFRSSSEELAAAAGCRFWFYDKGVALDIAHNVLVDEDAFLHLCSLLRTARRKRPIDCAVVVLPTADLVAIEKGASDEAKEISELLYQRLQQLQQEIKFIVPSFVVLSKSDALPGFSAFCGGLSNAQREEMLGWSSPFDPGAPYATSWVDTAFTDLYRTQCGLQVDLLASAKLSDKERDAAFLLPRNTQALLEPARLYVDQIYKTSVYSEGNLLRGIYLCGDGSNDSAMLQVAKGADKRRQPVFLLHLFTKKIFAESGLARPLRRGLISGAQALRAVKVGVAAAAVISILLLWSASATLLRNTRVVFGFLDTVPTESGRAVAQDRERFAHRTQDLLLAIGSVSTSRLMSFRLPTSLFSSVDGEIEDVMRDSFESVVLAGLHQGLELKAKQSLALDTEPQSIATVTPDSDEPPPAGEAWPGAGKREGSGRPTSKLVQVQALRAMPEFQELRDLAHSYAEFEQQVETYNRLGSDRHKRFDTVGPLVKYVFDVDLDQGFVKNADFYAESLANATYPPFDLRTVSPKAQKRARTICRALHRRLFVDNPIAIETEEIHQYINRLTAESETSAADLPTLTEVRDVLQRLERDLQRAEMQWMAKESLDLGDSFSELLSYLRRFSPNGDLADEIKLEWQSAHQQMRRQLLEQQLPGQGGMLSRDLEKNRLAMTPPMLNLKAGIESFLALPFVQMQIERPKQTTAEGAYKVNWNEEVLRQAIAQSDAYESYVRDRVGQVYQQIRDVVKHSALERLGQNMLALVGQARHVERVLRFSGDVNALQDEISAEVADLKRVSSALRQILENYERLGLKAAHSELYQQLEDDNRELLRRIDLLLERDEMYRISSKLSEWRGERPPALLAFDVDDVDALTQYIKTQRNRIKGWARDYAKVPVSLLDGLTSIGNSSDPLVTKWRNIVNQLEYFEKMTPGNSVKDMESFVDTTLITVTPDNCLDKLPRRTGDNSDYFLQTRARVYDAVRKRCLVYGAEKILELYNHLAKRFNRELAGKFPFTHNALTLDDPDAGPREIRDFYVEYDEFMARYDAYVARHDAPGGSDIGREISAFLEGLRSVRPFFAPLLSDRGNDAARYNIGLEYRVNRSSEINGQQIAEWSFTSSDQKVDDGQGQWQIGDRVRLSMRWAKDGPYVPAQNGQPLGATIDSNDSVNFEFTGVWGLVRLVRMYRASTTDLRKSLDRKPHIVKFLVSISERKPTGRLRLLPENYYNAKGKQSNNAAKLGFIFNKAMVFIRVTLAPREGGEPIILPVDWPSLAPGVRGGSP